MKMTDERPGNLVDFLEDLRSQRGISLRRLATETGVSASTLSRWREGKQTPSLESCRMLAEYLSVPVAHVLGLAGHLGTANRGNREAPPGVQDGAKLN
jgi:transcriptional regulator with XRE-family HTH domain